MKEVKAMKLPPPPPPPSRRGTPQQKKKGKPKPVPSSAARQSQPETLVLEGPSTINKKNTVSGTKTGSAEDVIS